MNTKCLMYVVFSATQKYKKNIDVSNKYLHGDGTLIEKLKKKKKTIFTRTWKFTPLFDVISNCLQFQKYWG